MKEKHTFQMYLVETDVTVRVWKIISNKWSNEMKTLYGKLWEMSRDRGAVCVNMVQGDRGKLW